MLKIYRLKEKLEKLQIDNYKVISMQKHLLVHRLILH
nr:MAG TPA: hypothetical protein [Caudoviricetes sp.]DAK71366.1 MAG TPA: hypothetical protein [Caudoviricetes sp.]